MKPYYSDDRVTIYHGDCREVLPSIDQTGCSLATDPPYGDTSLEWDQWPAGWPSMVTARQMWCFGSMRMWMSHHAEFEAAGWTYSQEVIWEKHNGSGFHADRFKRVHELALHWYRGPWSELSVAPVVVAEATARRVHRKKRPAHTGHIDEAHYESHEGGPKLMRSVMFARSCHGYAVHPTQKPTEILRPLIEYANTPVVLDPFMGSGSTLVAAIECGRRAVGVERNEVYCEIAARRASELLPL